MAAILGISAFYHDSAAALVVDGDLVAAAQEERFTRRKHDHAFPVHAIRYCLDEAGMGAFPISRSRAHTHRRHGHPLQTVPSAGLIERPQEKNRVDALR